MRSSKYQNKAVNLIEGKKQRATVARVRVLAFLLSQHSAVTHHDIEQGLGQDNIDYVTLYRVLDWLVEHELAHRLNNEDRIWRYFANEHKHSAHHHAHFQCVQCDKVVCLEEVPVKADFPIPGGYKAQEAELTIKGLCAQCN